MKLLEVSFDACQLKQTELLAGAARCVPAIEQVNKTRALKYDSLYASVQLPFDQQLKHAVLEQVHALQQLDPAMLIVIGIGGSNLGTMAVQEFCLGICTIQSNMQVRYVDTVDPDMVYCIHKQARMLLEAGRNVLVNIVTKSGRTTETIANAAIFVELLKHFHPKNYGDYIIVTTDSGSKLFDVARKEKWRLLEVPPLVGGRYSVFSAVGLFPLALMGIDIDALLRGAAAMVEQCTTRDVEKNIAAQSAAVLYELYQRGYVIHNFFPFAVDLHALGLWSRQLMAESLGKEYDLDGKKVNVGITPTVSIGSTDLHSIVELYLAGPDNTATTFVSVEQFHKQELVAVCSPLQQLVPHIQDRSLNIIMTALLDGTKKAYATAKRPYMSVALPEKSAEIIGQFIQWKMLETMYLGHLFNINPFIQPQVELYKNEARILLSQGSKA
jgi:glucose-6-phosphate isomerase